MRMIKQRKMVVEVVVEGMAIVDIALLLLLLKEMTRMDGLHRLQSRGRIMIESVYLCH